MSAVQAAAAGFKRSDGKISTMKQAVEKGDVEAVRDFLIRDAKPRSFSPLMHLAMTMSRVEIVKLFLQHGTDPDGTLVDQIFMSADGRLVFELVAHIIEHSRKDIGVVQYIFQALVFSEQQGSQALDTLKLLLDQGLPINSELKRSKYFKIPGPVLKSSPFILSIVNDRVDFMTLMLQRGADVNKKTDDGETLLTFAVSRFHKPPIIELLLKYGAKVDEVSSDGETALHVVAVNRSLINNSGDEKLIRLLLRYGADVNIPDRAGRTSLQDSSHRYRSVIIKELALLQFEGRLINRKNLEHLNANPVTQKEFNDYLIQLNEMKNTKFYNNFSLYDVIKMRNNPKKLALLIKNKEFSAALCESKKKLDRDFYLTEILFYAGFRADALLVEENQLKSIFKRDELPELVIRKLAYFIHEDLFIE